MQKQKQRFSPPNLFPSVLPHDPLRRGVESSCFGFSFKRPFSLLVFAGSFIQFFVVVESDEPNLPEGKRKALLSV